MSPDVPYHPRNTLLYIRIFIIVAINRSSYTASRTMHIIMLAISKRIIVTTSILSKILCQIAAIFSSEIHVARKLCIFRSSGVIFVLNYSPITKIESQLLFITGLNPSVHLFHSFVVGSKEEYLLE